MTKDDWDVVEEALMTPYGSVTLLCDGYHVTCRLEPLGNFRLVIKVYVNGFFKFSWLGLLSGDPSEEGRRFFPVHSCYVYGRKQRASLKKMSSKTRKLLDINMDKKYERRNFYWTSFSRLKAHFTKNNQSIQITETRE